MDLAAIDPMYQYSLSWFVALFYRAIADSEQSDDLDTRMSFLNNFFTYFLFVNVSRSLFEKDKLLFAFLLAARIQEAAERLQPAELRFLLTGGISMGELPMDNPDTSWLSEKSWGEICRLSSMPSPVWANFHDSFAR